MEFTGIPKCISDDSSHMFGASLQVAMRNMSRQWYSLLDIASRTCFSMRMQLTCERH